MQTGERLEAEVGTGAKVEAKAEVRKEVGTNF